MKVKFLEDVLYEGMVLTKAGSTGVVKEFFGGSKYHVIFDNPILPNYTEAVVAADKVEVLDGGLKGLINRIIKIDNVDIESFESYKRRCSELKGVIDPTTALYYSIEGATIASYLATYKAMLKYTEEKLDAEVKKAYALAISSAVGSSQDKREAEAKQNSNYLSKLEELSEVKAAQIYVNSAYDYALNMYYLFKEVYVGEKKALQNIDPRNQ